MRTVWPLRIVATFLILFELVAGCPTMTGRSAGRDVDDSTITASVKSKLVAARAANVTGVSVKTVNGTVYLDGVVNAPEEKERATVLASQAKGVREIVNDLQVRSQPAASPR